MPAQDGAAPSSKPVYTSASPPETGGSAVDNIQKGSEGTNSGDTAEEEDRRTLIQGAVAGVSVLVLGALGLPYIEEHRKIVNTESVSKSDVVKNVNIAETKAKVEQVAEKAKEEVKQVVEQGNEEAKTEEKESVWEKAREAFDEAIDQD